MKLLTCYINLKHRPERDQHMQAELKRVGLTAHRMQGMLPNEYKGDKKLVATMMNRTPGAIGCHISQVKLMNLGLMRKQNIMVLEDDLVFCSDFKKRLKHIEKFLRKRRGNWDVFWLGGTYHYPEAVWHAKGHPQLRGCKCTNQCDAQPTYDPHIMRTYGAFSTHAYIVNWRSVPKIMKLFAEHLQESIGIDWLFIRIQPQLNTFAFNPGCVKQYDNKSDIGNGITMFSGFEKSLGPHWFQDKM